MAAKSLPRWRLAARALGIWARVSKHWVRFWIGWALLWLGRVVVDLFRELGATFIKVGQIMSTRPDILPEYVSNALAELQDHVGPFPFEDVVRTIEGDLGRPLHTLYAEFAPVR